MSQPSVKGLPLVEVEWLDATFIRGWQTPDEMVREELALCRTAGYLLRRDKKIVQVVQTKGGSTGNLADGIVIPAMAVKRIRRLKR